MSDLINREEAIEAIDNALYDIFAEPKGLGEEILNKLPSVEKTGYWYDKGSLSCRCSECGCKSPQEFKYCPNCGARMEVSDD